MPERWCDLADFRVRDAELLKIDFPRPDGLPDLRHHLRGFGLGEGEPCMRGQCVVQGGQSPLRAHAQMQEALGGVACSGQDVVQRAQAPAGQPGVPQKAVVTQVVVVVAHQNVEDHAFEKFCVVCTDDAGVAVLTLFDSKTWRAKARHGHHAPRLWAVHRRVPCHPQKWLRGAQVRAALLQCGLQPP